MPDDVKMFVVSIAVLTLFTSAAIFVATKVVPPLDDALAASPAAEYLVHPDAGPSCVVVSGNAFGGGQERHIVCAEDSE